MPPDDLPPPAAEPDDLPRQLRESDSDELLSLVREHGPRLEVAAVRQVMTNPYLTREVISELARNRRLLSSYEVRREIARHPRTAQALALRFVPGLYWRDLVELGTDARVHPVIRRAADRYLISRLSALAVGEKMAVARRGGPGAMAHLRHDPSPRVIGALLENPKLTEGILYPLVRSEAAAPEVLELVAGNRRWGVRYGIRAGLARNPRTPVEAALRILPLLKKPDLRAVAAEVRLAPAVRRRARLLLGER